MLKSHQVGRIRIELAKVLSEFCGEHVAPALLCRNYGPSDYGFSYSWDYNGEKTHPLCGVGSGMTMTDFVRYINAGYLIVLQRNELFLIG